ncbi:hypothetical protein AVEN_207517-1, partial [Araneus ventricosus]
PSGTEDVVRVYAEAQTQNWETPTEVFGGKPQIRNQHPKNIKERKITTPTEFDLKNYLMIGLLREGKTSGSGLP